MLSEGIYRVSPKYSFSVPLVSLKYWYSYGSGHAIINIIITQPAIRFRAETYNMSHLLGSCTGYRLSRATGQFPGPDEQPMWLILGHAIKCWCEEGLGRDRTAHR